jgi:hypothetical protein
MKILIPIKTSEELPEHYGSLHMAYYKDDGFVGGYEMPVWYEQSHWRSVERGKEIPLEQIEYWYKPVSKAEYDKQVLAEKIDEIDKAVSEVEDMHPYKQAGNRDSYSEYNEGWSDACDILGETIKTKLL